MSIPIKDMVSTGLLNVADEIDTNPIWEPEVKKLAVPIRDLEKEYDIVAKRALTNADARIDADRIAKGAPIITKGILSAAAAFEKKDYITGTSALMDICSGLSFLLPPPTGPILGAFFNSVGQFLIFFVKKESSLEDKIEKMLLHLKAGQQKENIAAVGHSITSYTTSLRTKCEGTTNSKGIAQILAMPLESESQADDFIVEMKGLQWGLERDTVKFDVPAFANWQVAGYLENEDNWGTEGWPEVLGIWCRTYIDLRTANIMLNCLANPKTLDTLINDTREENKNSLPKLTPHTKRKCHNALLNLKSLVNMLPRSWESDKEEMLKIVDAVRPAARERGTYAHVGWWKERNGNILYVASGTGSNKDALKWVYKKETAWLKRVSIHISNAEKDSFTPKYEVFACELDNKIGRHTLDSVTNTLSNRTEVISPRPNEKFLDVSAMAIINIGHHYDFNLKHDSMTFVTLVIENNKDNFVNLYVIDKDNKSTKALWEPDTEYIALIVGAKDVRGLYLPPTPLPGDPDADAVADNNAKPQGRPLLAQNKYSFLSYVGVREGNKIIKFTRIYVGTTVEDWSHKPKYGYVEGPENWTSYNGIEVDPYYLWVFGKGGIACATHASIIKCRQGKIPRPSWIHHDFDKQFFPSAPEVTSFCPCADGTLVANIQDNITKSS